MKEEAYFSTTIGKLAVYSDWYTNQANALKVYLAQILTDVV